MTTPALAAWLVQAEQLLTIEAEDGSRHSLPADDPRMAAAWPVWQGWVRQYEEAERDALESR